MHWITADNNAPTILIKQAEHRQFGNDNRLTKDKTVAEQAVHAAAQMRQTGYLQKI